MYFLVLNGNRCIPPSVRTIERFRKKLFRNDLFECLFKCFNDYLDKLDFKSQQYQTIDAGIVKIPCQQIISTEGNEQHVYADSVYTSQAHEGLLEQNGLEGWMHHPQNPAKHIFGMPLKKTRTLIICVAQHTRARGIIGLRHFSYNLTRFVWLMTSKWKTVSEDG